jgi:hypothetical protein
MYGTDTPEDYLTHRGSMQIKPLSPKGEEKEKEKLNNDIIRHNLIIDEKKEDLREKLEERQLKSCCFLIDEKILLFFSKFVISLMVLLFSFYQMYNNKGDCATSIGYSSFINIIIGYWLSKV